MRCLHERFENVGKGSKMFRFVLISLQIIIQFIISLQIEHLVYQIETKIVQFASTIWVLIYKQPEQEVVRSTGVIITKPISNLSTSNITF